MQETSAGILLYHGDKVFLTHSGGLHMKNQDKWAIPKGHVEEGEQTLDTAIREFQEETGIVIPDHTRFFCIGETESKSKKKVIIYAYEGSGEEKFGGSNMIDFEWPRKSGNIIQIPENDKGEWFTLEEAYKKIYEYQRIFLLNLKRFNS